MRGVRGVLQLVVAVHPPGDYRARMVLMLLLQRWTMQRYWGLTTYMQM